MQRSGIRLVVHQFLEHMTMQGPGRGLRWFMRPKCYFHLWEYFGTKVLAQTLSSPPEDKDSVITIHPKDLDHPISLRLHPADLFIYQEVLLDKGYELELHQKPEVIIDLGANIGLSSISFLQQFPHAKVIAIEPSLKNFKLLEQNLSYYPNAIAVHAAIWNQDGPLNLQGADDDFMTFTVDPSHSKDSVISQVEGVTMSTLMKRFDIGHVDLLKVDIEGAEQELFETAKDWIDQVEAIVIESHERFRSGCMRNYYRATEGFEDVSCENGQMVFFARRPSASQPKQS